MGLEILQDPTHKLTILVKCDLHCDTPAMKRHYRDSKQDTFLTLLRLFKI